MADTSKAEKLAAARKKLKEFQQRNKESTTSNARSTPCSQKSNSPVDSVLSLKDQINITIQGNSLDYSHETNLNNEGNIDNLPLSYNTVTNGTENSQISLFSFQNQSTNQSNHEHFFDNISQDTNSDNSHLSTKENSQLSTNSNSHFSTSINSVDTSLQRNSPKVDQKENTDNSLVNKFGDENQNETLLRITDMENKFLSEKQNSEELQRKLFDSHHHILSLQHEIKRLNEEQNHRVAQEVLQLEEKLKFQQQTIEILVSDKSELQKELMLLQDETKANKSKSDELASRLKASRSQVQKLEKELSEKTETKSQHNSILKKLENDLQEKESAVQDALKNLNAAKIEIRELEKRNEVGLRDQEGLRLQLQEKEKEFSIAQIKLTQLGGETNNNILNEVESLKSELEKTRKNAETTLEESTKTETELRQYISNLNAQVLQANAKCERAERDKEDLTLKVENLIKHISEMERQLQRNKSNLESMKLPEESETITSLIQEVADLKGNINNKDQQLLGLENELFEIREKLSEAESWRENVPDMSLLQAAMESDRVAAARAVEQNNALKDKLTELEGYILKVNNSKLELTEELDKYRHMAGEYRLQLEKYKSRQEMRMVDSVTQTIKKKKDHAVTQTAIHDIASITDPHEPVSVETLVVIEEKLKKTMDRVADLSDEKQRLEHLVLQLQSETETIGEYVTLYQNQRSLLQQKAEEKERQMTVITKERAELKSKLDEINNLLTKFPHNPEVENTTCKISSLVSEIQCSSIVQEKVEPPSTFHPCLLCSGKLITV